MKRYAAHYIFLSNGIYKLHYIELNAENYIVGVYPLANEISETVFCNGILFPVSMQLPLSVHEIREHLKTLQSQYPSDSVFDLLKKSAIVCSQSDVPVVVYQLNSLMRSSKADNAAFAPSPMDMIICL